jgi:hypothetical protein
MVTVIAVVLCEVILALTPPIVTVLPDDEKPVPFIVIDAPTTPVEALRLLIAGAILKVVPAPLVWLHVFVTNTLPHIPAAIVTVIAVVFCAVMLALTPPIVTLLPEDEKPVPLIVKEEPIVALEELKLLMAGVTLKVVPAPFVWLHEFVTNTLPHIPAAIVTVIAVVLWDVILAPTPPIVTLLPEDEKPVPLMVIALPTVPVDALRLLITGVTLKVVPAALVWLQVLVTKTLPHMLAAIVTVIAVVL